MDVAALIQFIPALLGSGGIVYLVLKNRADRAHYTYEGDLDMQRRLLERIDGLEERLDSLYSEYEGKLEDLRTHYNKKIEEMRRNHAAEMAKLRAEHKAEIDEWEDRFVAIIAVVRNVDNKSVRDEVEKIIKTKL